MHIQLVTSETAVCQSRLMRFCTDNRTTCKIRLTPQIQVRFTPGSRSWPHNRIATDLSNVLADRPLSSVHKPFYCTALLPVRQLPLLQLVPISLLALVGVWSQSSTVLAPTNSSTCPGLLPWILDPGQEPFSIRSSPSKSFSSPFQVPSKSLSSSVHVPSKYSPVLFRTLQSRPFHSCVVLTKPCPIAGHIHLRTLLASIKENPTNKERSYNLPDSQSRQSTVAEVGETQHVSRICTWWLQLVHWTIILRLFPLFISLQIMKVPSFFSIQCSMLYHISLTSETIPWITRRNWSTRHIYCVSTFINLSYW